MDMHNTKIDLTKGKREKVIELLNQSLADAMDLKSQAKQAHWNVKGPSFIALHELFDQVATGVAGHIDEMGDGYTAGGITNVVPTASWGGREDALICEYGLRSARVVFGSAEAEFRMWEAYHQGRSLVLVTHLERAELYVEQFADRGLCATIEPA